MCALTLNVGECKIIFGVTPRVDVKRLRINGYGNVSKAVPDLSSAVDKFTKLETLFLLDFKLVDRSTLFPFRNVSQLRLSVAQLNGDNFVDLNNLEILWIAFSRLTILPTGIFSTDNKIRELHLLNNLLVDLHPDVFEKLRNVEILKINDNKLAALPANIFRNNEKIRDLDLHTNNLKDIHEDLFNGLVNLSVLDLCSNRIEIIPPGLFRSNSKLTNVRLDNNKLKKIGVDLFTMPKLKIIKFRANQCINENFDFPQQSRSQANDKIRRFC